MTTKPPFAARIFVILIILTFACTLAKTFTGQNTDSEEVNADYEVEELVLGLRDLLYSDATLDQALEMFQSDDSELSLEVMRAIQDDDLTGATTALAAYNNSQDFNQARFYWLAMAKTISGWSL